MFCLEKIKILWQLWMGDYIITGYADELFTVITGRVMEAMIIWRWQDPK